MTTGEQLYLAVVLATFMGFGVWLAYNSWRFDRTQRVVVAVQPGPTYAGRSRT